MAEPPQKKQRIAPETQGANHTSLDADQLDPHAPSNPRTPPRRRSYLSPTKASLARSHPDILAKSPKRGSLTEPRGRLLRQELLGIKNTPSNITVTTASDATPGPIRVVEGREQPETANDEGDKTGFAAAIAQTFRDSETEAITDKEQPRGAVRSPLRTRQPPGTSSSKRHREEDNANAFKPPQAPVPKLVRKSDRSTRHRSEAGDEPELPPTPVQLGMGRAPDRPRGLASSSSVGSRSGSGRHRRRVRGAGSTAITSSPLKPKDKGPVPSPSLSDLEENYNQPAEEAAESDSEDRQHQRLDQVQHNFPDIERRDVDPKPVELTEKEAMLTKMKSELERLRQELAQIESLTDTIDREHDLEIPANTLRILQSQPVDRSLDSQSPSLHPSFVKDPSAYLTLFSPANLRLNHRTATESVQERPKIIHSLTVSAPNQWPPDALHLALDVTIDIEEARIDSITQTASDSPGRSNSLSQWIESRLRAPLHKHDVSGLIWGAGQYFSACIDRAKALRAIEEMSRGNQKNAFPSKRDTPSQLSLYPYLHRSQMAISLSMPKQIMITYEINFTWTGDTRGQVDLTFAGVNGKTQKSAKELFAKLLASEGVVGAFEGVRALLDSS